MTGASAIPGPETQVRGGAPEREPSTRALALRGSVWSVLVYGFSQVLSLGSNILLAAWLDQEPFGYMGMVAVFIRGLQMFSDLGIGPSIIQHARGEEKLFRDTAWTVQAARGIALWVVTGLIAWPVSRAYGPQYLWLLPAVGFSAVIAGFNATAIFTVNRRMVYGKLAAVELASQCVSIGVMVTWAYYQRDVWPLVGGTLAGAMVRMVLSHAVLGGWQDRFRLDRAALHELLKFGGWITVSTAVTFLAGQADRLILGLIASAALLGVYNQALRLARLPVDLAATLAVSVLFPALSRAVRANESSLEPSFRRARAAILPVALVATLGVALGAPIFFDVFYAKSWGAARWIAPALAGVFWFELLQLSADRVLLATGRTRALAASNVAKAAITAAGCLGGNAFWGLEGFLAGMALGSLAAHVVVQVSLWRMRIAIVGEDLRYTGALLGLFALSMGCTFFLAKTVVGGVPLAAAFIPAAVIGTVSAAWCWGRVRHAFVH